MHYLHFGTIMSGNFNTYIEQIDFENWCEFCVNKGTLRHFAKGEEFLRQHQLFSEFLRKIFVHLVVRNQFGGQSVDKSYITRSPII